MAGDLAVIGESLRRVGDALSLSAHVLARDPTQMAGQIAGRLAAGTTPAVDRLLAGANAWNAVATLCPSTPSLAAPGGSLVATLAGHDAEVLAVALSPDGACLVSGAADGSVVAWDLATGATRWAVRAHEGPVSVLVVHPDGSRVASASEDGTIRLWDLDGGRALPTGIDVPGPVRALAFLPGGDGVVSADPDAVRRWDLSSGRQVLELAGGRSIAPSPDGRTVAVLSGDEITLRDAATGRPLSSVRVGAEGDGDDAEARFATGLALTPDGRRVILLESFLGGEGGSYEVLDRVRVWTLGADVPPRRMESRGPLAGTIQMRPRCVVATPDGRSAISGSSDHTVKVWGLDGPLEPRVLAGHAHEVVGVAVTPDGRRLVSASRDRTVKVWDLDRSAAADAELPHGGEVNATAVTPDGRHAASVASDGTLVLWEAGGRRRRFALPGEMAWSVALGDDGRRAAVGTHGGSILVWDVERGEPLATVPGDGQPVMHLFAAHGSGAVCAISVNGVVTVWRDLESGGAPAARFEAPKGMTPLFGMTATPDGATVLAGGPDGSVSLWHPGDAVPRLLGAHGTRVTTTALTADGRRGVSAAADGTLRVWDVASGAEIGAWVGHAGSIIRVAVTPDGERVLSCSKDSTFRIWEAATGRLVAEFTGESGMLSCAAAPDASTCVVGEHSGRVHLLRLHAGPFVRPAPARRPEPAATPLETARAEAARLEGRLAADPADPSVAGHLAAAYASLAMAYGGAEQFEHVVPYLVRARDLLEGLERSGAALDEPGRALIEQLRSELRRPMEGVAFPPDTLQDDQPQGPPVAVGGGPVRAVTVIPDGRVASGSDDGVVRIWDLERSRLLGALEGHRGWVMALAALPDGRLASGSMDETLRLWDPRRAVAEAILEPHGGPVYAVAVLPDGRVLSGSDDGLIRIWDVERGRSLGRLEGHRGPVMSLAALPDGRLLSGSMDETLRLWDPRRGVTEVTLAGHHGAVMGIAVVPDGSGALTASFDQTLILWDLRQGSAVARMAGHFDAARAARILPDGRRAVTSFYDGSIRIWDLVWQAEVATLVGHAGPVGALALTPDGRHVVSASDDGTLRVWDLRLTPRA